MGLYIEPNLKCLLMSFIKRWPTVNDLEIPDILWLSVDEGILRLREIAMLEWIYCVYPLPTHSPFLALAFPCTGAYKVCRDMWI